MQRYEKKMKTKGIRGEVFYEDEGKIPFASYWGTLVFFGATLYQMGTDDCPFLFVAIPLRQFYQ